MLKKPIDIVAVVKISPRETIVVGKWDLPAFLLTTSVGHSPSELGRRRLLPFIEGAVVGGREVGVRVEWARLRPVLIHQSRACAAHLLILAAVVAGVLLVLGQVVDGLADAAVVEAVWVVHVVLNHALVRLN